MLGTAPVLSLDKAGVHFRATSEDWFRNAEAAFAAEVFNLDSWIDLALPGAVAYAASLLGDRNKGQDVVQDCVCRLLGAAARYDLPRDGRKLLFRSITNACINVQTRTRETISIDDVGRLPEGGTWEMRDAAALEPPVLAMAGELRQAILNALQTLPLLQRSSLELSSLGYRADEIAEMLELKPEHVRVLLHRARKTMAALLSRADDAQPETMAQSAPVEKSAS